MKNKLRQSARGEECTLSIHPYCNGNPDTTVLCHIGRGAGMGRKSSDLMAVYGCSACHDVIDLRVRTDITRLELMQIKLRALERTHARMIDSGTIKF